MIYLLYLVYGICGWMALGIIMFIIHYYIFFRGVRHVIHCYIFSSKERHKIIAQSLLSPSRLSNEEYAKNPVNLLEPKIILFSVSCILGPFKILDFVGDVVYFTFRWESSNDKNTTKNS